VTDELLRVYFDPEEIGADGYPYAWHKATFIDGGDSGCDALYPAVKDMIRQQAGNRCERCGHPYEKGMGKWSPCDERCRHGGPVRYQQAFALGAWEHYHGPDETIATYVEASWRILTVHHLNGVKHDLRWWNLAALCQRCHLSIQGKVIMDRIWPMEHSEWFKPHAAGWYAWAYLMEDLSREETVARMDELLGLERIA
jgi:hypothetical protein